MAIVYMVVYGEAPFQFYMFNDYQSAVHKLRSCSLNMPRATCRIDTYRCGDDGMYHKDVVSDDW